MGAPYESCVRVVQPLRLSHYVLVIDLGNQLRHVTFLLILFIMQGKLKYVTSLVNGFGMRWTVGITMYEVALGSAIRVLEM